MHGEKTGQENRSFQPTFLLLFSLCILCALCVSVVHRPRRSFQPRRPKTRAANRKDEPQRHGEHRECTERKPGRKTDLSSQLFCSYSLCAFSVLSVSLWFTVLAAPSSHGARRRGQRTVKMNHRDTESTENARRENRAGKQIFPANFFALILFVHSLCSLCLCGSPSSPLLPATAPEDAGSEP